MGERRRSKRVMVVDDREDVRELALAILDGCGYEAVGAPNGRLALEKAARSEIDLLLIDVNLAGASGIEVAKQMTRSHPGLPVLFMSGYAPLSEVEQVPGARMIQKPFMAPDLIAQVGDLLGQ